MNLWYSLSLHPKTFSWKWTPKVKFQHWPLKSKKEEVFYLNIEWFNWHVQIDNEW